MATMAIICFVFMTILPLGGVVAEVVKGKAARARK